MRSANVKKIPNKAPPWKLATSSERTLNARTAARTYSCLLYTSDAADD